MTKLRIYGTSLTGTSGVKLRVYATSLTGTAVTGAKLRVYATSLTGTVSALVTPLAAQTKEPETAVTITASTVDGNAPDSWSWRQVSGPTVAFSGTGATRSFTAPSAMPPGATVVVGVRAIKGGVLSPEVTCTVTVLPQTEWSRVPGGQWVGATRP